MEELIKIAQEWGYKYHSWGELSKDIANSIRWLAFNPERKTFHPVNENDFLLDPLFYQALGKAKGWKKWHDHEWDDDGIVGFSEEKYHALRTLEIILTEGMDKGIEHLKSIVVK